MTVSRNQGTDAIYAMHARWLTEVLGPGDSLFTPGTAVWTKGHLDELERAFVAHPDTTPGRRYEEKLRDQLAGVSPEAKQLMAELHAVHFLMIWVGAISAATKVSILNAILAWMPAPPDVPADVVRGDGARARPPWYLGHDAARHADHLADPVLGGVEALPGTTSRQALVADPWALKEFTGQR